jgi:uncharacterized protein (DUF302 family)
VTWVFRLKTAEDLEPLVGVRIVMLKERCMLRTSLLVAMIAAISLLGTNAIAAEGLTTIQSNFGPKETIERLQADIAAKGLILFAQIDHAAGGAQVGLPLRPTELLIFGNPKAGTPLMQSNQTIGIDLPLKALVWQDVNGKTWLSYNDPSWLAKRHGLGVEAERGISAITATLSDVAAKATGRQ